MSHLFDPIRQAADWLMADTNRLSAYSTLALAAVGIISIFTNFALARSTRRAAWAALQQAELEREQLDVIERQMELAEREYEVNRETAKPRLTAFGVGIGDRYADVTIRYVSGSEIAHGALVWVVANGTLYVVGVDVIGPTDEIPVKAMQSDWDDWIELPKEIAPLRGRSQGRWAAVTWKRFGSEADSWGPLPV